MNRTFGRPYDRARGEPPKHRPARRRTSDVGRSIERCGVQPWSDEWWSLEMERVGLKLGESVASEATEDAA